MKKRNSLRIFFGAFLLACGIFYQLFTPDYSVVSAIFMINFGFVILLVGLIRHWRFRNEPEQDERTKMVAYTALAASFQLTLLGLAILWWVDYYFPLQLTLQEFISMVILGMAVLVIFFRTYYNRKKEI